MARPAVSEEQIFNLLQNAAPHFLGGRVSRMMVKVCGGDGAHLQQPKILL